jgi:hypothetical protein
VWLHMVTCGYNVATIWLQYVIVFCSLGLECKIFALLFTPLALHSARSSRASFPPITHRAFVMALDKKKKTAAKSASSATVATKHAPSNSPGRKRHCDDGPPDQATKKRKVQSVPSDHSDDEGEDKDEETSETSETSEGSSEEEVPVKKEKKSKNKKTKKEKGPSRRHVNEV